MNSAIGDGRGGSAAVAALSARWRTGSLAAGWTVQRDWWVPAVDLVASTACRGEDLVASCGQLAAARARDGVGIGETLDDIDALHAALGAPPPAMPVVKAVAESWAEVGLAGLAESDCEDPLTGLTTTAYLRTRIAEIYRARRPDGHALILVDMCGDQPGWPADRWKRLVKAMIVGRYLRAAFRDGETLSLLGARRAAVLVVSRPGLDRRVAALRTVLTGHYGARVRVVRLPTRGDQAVALLGALTAGVP